MARSMTGFAHAVAENGEFSVRCSIRGVNHRSLDLKLRMPPEAASLEVGVRRTIRQRVRRGSVTVTVQVDSRGVPSARVDSNLVRARIAALEEIAKIAGTRCDADPNTLISFPGVYLQTSAEVPADQLKPLLATSIERALDGFERARDEEGRGIAADIASHAATISSEVVALAATYDSIVESRQALLRERIEHLLDGTPADPQRFAQEAAILASRSDASEELQRLQSHLESLRDCLASDSEAGKRIDFVAQEMNREANTLLSKSQPLGTCGLPVTEAGIRIRSAIEKIREQAMNLE